MSFLAPTALSLALLIPVVVAMYLLKLRRTKQPVSSVYLWRRMVRDVEANAPWQRLRFNLLLLVQLLVLAALILALARPFTWTTGVGGQAAILILDASASMAGTDVQPSRLEAAKAQARQMVDDMPEETRVTVIAAGDGAQVRAASSRDRRQVRSAIEGIEVQAVGSDLTPALELASALASRQPDAEIVLFSDGRVTLPERMRLAEPVRYMPIGIGGDNQAIAVFSTQAAPGGGLSAFVQVANYGPDLASRRLSILADGRLVGAYDVEIPPGGQRAVVIDNLPIEVELLQARLSEGDVLPLDDSAWVVNRSGNPTRVTLISEGNLFLQTALALFPNLEVTVVRPAEYEPAAQASPTEGDLDGLTILDAYVPLTATLPAGNLLFVGAPRSTRYFSVTGTVDHPVPRAVTAIGGQVADPLLAHINLSGVSVLEAARIPQPTWAHEVIAGDLPGGQASVPLLFAGRIEDRRVAVLAFDLHSSDLPLQVAFPLLIANLTGWLAPESDGGLPRQIAPHAPLSWPVPPEVDAVEVTRPDGSVMRLSPEDGRVTLADTGQLGVYRVVWGSAEEGAFAVNLVSAQESDLSPAGTLPLAAGGGASGGDGVGQARREWWRPLALAALLFLAAEWAIYQRATLVQLWAGIRRRPS